MFGLISKGKGIGMFVGFDCALLMFNWDAEFIIDCKTIVFINYLFILS